MPDGASFARVPGCDSAGRGPHGPGACTCCRGYSCSGPSENSGRVSKCVGAAAQVSACRFQKSRWVARRPCAERPLGLPRGRLTLRPAPPPLGGRCLVKHLRRRCFLHIRSSEQSHADCLGPGETVCPGNSGQSPRHHAGVPLQLALR